MNGEREMVDGPAGSDVFGFTSTPFKTVFRPALCARDSSKEVRMGIDLAESIEQVGNDRMTKLDRT